MKLLAPNLYKVILTNKAMRTSSRNLYIIKGNGRSLMIDTSWKVPECLNEMEHVLKELSIDYRDLDIFVTHNHADHSGYISLFIKTMVAVGTFGDLHGVHEGPGSYSGLSAERASDSLFENTQPQ